MSQLKQAATPAALADYPFLFSLNVAWGEMDAFQHVNNVVYFRWFESARVAWGRACGLMPRDDGCGPILAATSARYKRALVYPDSVCVGVRIDRIAADRLWQQYALFSDSQQLITTTGEAEIVWFDHRKGGKQAWSNELITAIETQEGRAIARV